MAIFRFYSPEAFEPWDARNPDEVGIGNSETNHLEMAWRLAARGHTVHSYTPRRPDTPDSWRGVQWHDVTQHGRFSAPGIWVLYRCPPVLDVFQPAPDRKAWLVCQDSHYVRPPRDLSPARGDRLDKIITLCRHQEREYCRLYPQWARKIVRGSNSLRPELVKEVLAENLPRDPLRISYASSPDRALEPLVRIFSRAREFVPGLSLHVFYGMDNVNKVEQQARAVLNDPRQSGWAKKAIRSNEKIRELLATPGVVNHGRIPQPQLYREWARTGLLVYPCSHFPETGWVTGMEAQALGAVPVCGGPWATMEHALGGAFVHGDALMDPLTRARFTAEVVDLAQHPEKQEEIRRWLMPQALTRFAPEWVLDLWENWAESSPPEVAA